MNEDRDIDARRAFIVMVLIAFMILGYELFNYYFAPKPQPQQTEQTGEERPVTKTGQPKEDKKVSKGGGENEEVQKRVSLPGLLLGSTREKQPEGKIYRLENENFLIEVSSVGGRLVRILDKKFNRELITETEKALKVYPLEVFTGNPDIDYGLNFGNYNVTVEGNTIRLELGGDVKAEKVIELRKNHLNVKVRVDVVEGFYILGGTHPKEGDFYTHSGPVVKFKNDLVRIDKEDIEGREVIRGDIVFAGEESRYYFKGFKGKIEETLIYKVKFEDREKTFTLVRADSGELLYYSGAKEYSRLKEIGLVDIIDFGSLKLVVKPLFIFMYWVYEHTSSWILSIFILTLLIRIVFFPLSYKSTVSMMKLGELAPKMEEIKKRYKDDPAKMQEAMMKLYSEAGVNPMSGCLPMLIQIPIFFALYKVLIVTVDLKLAGMLWIPSLADKDPFYVLPVLMGGTMVLQQFIMPNPDKKQNLIMYISAVAFTFLFANFPSGLVLYWTFNNVLNIGQNYLIKEVMLKDKKELNQKPSRKKRKK